MRNLSKYIIEKLQLNKSITVESSIMELAQDEQWVKDNCKSGSISIPYVNAGEDRRDWDKMNEYKHKGSKPQRLVNSIKDRDKLLRRFRIACQMKWYECVEAFGDAIIERGYYKKEQVILFIHNTYKF